MRSEARGSSRADGLTPYHEAPLAITERCMQNLTFCAKARPDKAPLIMEKIKLSMQRSVNVCRVADYHLSSLVLSQLEKNMRRWVQPSEPIHVDMVLHLMGNLLINLMSEYADEYKTIPTSHFKTCWREYHNAMNCQAKVGGRTWRGEDSPHNNGMLSAPISRRRRCHNGVDARA